MAKKSTRAETQKAAKQPAKYAAQSEYTAAKRAAGEQIKLTADLKAEDDVKNYRALQRRFPDLKQGALVRLALRELGAKKNRR